MVLCALGFALASAIVWQTFMSHDMYELMDVSAGLALPGPSFLFDGRRYSQASLAVIILFYSSLWSIKLSFLIFFRRLGKNVARQKLIWWPVLGFTVASYVVAISILQYRCLVNSMLYLIENCTTDSAIQFQRATLLCSCVLDVLTDLSSQRIVPLSRSKLTNLPSFVTTNRAAMGGSNQDAPKTSPRRYLLPRHHHHYFRHHSYRRRNDSDPLARHVLAIHVECNRDHRR